MSPFRNQSRTSPLIFLAALALTLAFAVAQWRKTAQLTHELESAQVALKESQSGLAQQDASIAALETQVLGLTEVLTQSTEKLQQATAALNAIPSGSQAPPPLSAAEISQLQAAVKDPFVTTETDRKGAEIKTYVFPELIDPDGKHLASNMEFTRLYGTKLAFKSASGAPASYEAEELHPGILAHLDISLYDAKQKQEEWENQIKRRKEIAMQQQAARQRAELERRKHEAERLKEELDRKAKIARIENDRMLAEAAIRQADAAIMEAQRPPDNYYSQPVIYGNGFGNGIGFIPTQSNANGPMGPTVNGPLAPNANQVAAPQGAPQPKPFVAPTGQLPPRGQLKIP